MPALTDIREFVPVNKVVKQAALDMYEDLQKFEARGTAWCVRGIEKLTQETLKSGKRYAILTVNRNLNTAPLPCDFKEEIFVGVINSCGEKIPLIQNPRLVNINNVETIPCDVECEVKCKDCYEKQMCCDLQSTQVINKILINTVEYDQTVTSTLQPNGEYYVVTTTPFLNTTTGLIEYRNKKEYITTLDTAPCGCVKITEENVCKIKEFCYDVYCCYCTGCTEPDLELGGYKVFMENQIIQFGNGMGFDKVYIEYRGSLPKDGNEFLVPKVAFETLINFVKFKSVENKKGVALRERDYFFSQYTRERNNMTKVMGRMSLAQIINSAFRVPKFYYNASNECYYKGTTEDETTTTTATSSSSPGVVITPPPNCPGVITITGADMTAGVTYNNSALAGIPIIVFANAFNRFLQPGEYTQLAGGGFTMLIGSYSEADYFFIFPNCTLITITGASIINGTYNNGSLAGMNLTIYANSINRYLQPSEFTVLAGGGFTTTITYGATDYFYIFPS